MILPIMESSSYRENECLLHFLYAYEVNEEMPSPEAITISMESLRLSRAKALAAYEKCLQLLQKIEEIDQKIASLSKEYTLSRMTKIDLCVLRWAFFQRYQHPLEGPRILSEAIRLSKKFSTPEASKFIHAILDEKVLSVVS